MAALGSLEPYGARPGRRPGEEMSEGGKTKENGTEKKKHENEGQVNGENSTSKGSQPTAAPDFPGQRGAPRGPRQEKGELEGRTG